VRTRGLFVAAAGLALGLARPASACCQLGGTACGDPFAVDCNNGVVCFPPFRSCPSCTCVATNNGKSCVANAALPGSLVPLLVSRSATPGSIDLSWGASCRPGVAAYAVHEGAIGTWYSHEARQCTAGGTLSTTLAPFGGDRYYLIAPIAGGFTGSLGTSSAGTERPDGIASCTSDRALAPCP
jgi:hypothetical protein